jgi:hypothetical protein
VLNQGAWETGVNKSHTNIKAEKESDKKDGRKYATIEDVRKKYQGGI